MPATVVMACPLRRGIGIEDLVEAARLIRLDSASKRRRPPRILLVGTVAARDSASLPERQLCDWHDDGLIQWRDSPEDPASPFDAADAILLPNLKSSEIAPFPRLPGKRLIVFAGTDLRHAIGIGDAYRVVPAGDPARLADAIVDAIGIDAAPV